MNSSPLDASRTILIVDDVPENLRVLSKTLLGQGYQVRCAKNGAMALMGANTAPPDVILLDIKMPDLDGYEVCRRLKASPTTRDIPVVFLSASDDVLDKVKAFEVGGVDYITKPFEIAEVLARVQSQIALRSAKAEISQLNTQLEQRIQQRTLQLQAANQQLQREIGERKLAEKRLQESEERLESILNSLEEVVWSVCPKTRKLFYLNPAAQKVYGRPVAEFFENPNLWLEAVHPEDRRKVERSHQMLLQQGSAELEYRILQPDGRVRWVSTRSRVIYENGVAVRLDGIVYDITRRKQAEEQLVYDALHDALTGLPNRNLFMERLESALHRAKRNTNYLFAVLFIDLDRFKVVNDSLGHTLGDQLLCAIADLLQQCLRSTDTIARFGGDEFTILLDDIKDITDAIRIAERLQAQLTAPFQLENHTIFSSASIGIALSSPSYLEAQDLLRDADIAMYQAKEQGKARYAIFDQEMYQKTLKLLRLESDLRQALERQEFCLHYQPIISLTTGKLTGFEALIRWRHPQRGLISPTNFISVAEDIGLIVTIGEWVLQEACRQLHVWQAQFPHLMPLKLSVNIAGQQIREPNFIHQIDRVLTETGLDGSYLQLEITESTLIEYAQETVRTLLEIRSRRIQLSIDDFGQGYSSLSYLHRFPINSLKIDRSFVSGMHSNGENYEIVRTITTLAHILGMNVVAEGVETPEQFSVLRTLGCEFGQGYLFARSLNCASATALMANNPQWLELTELNQPL
ncbi:response regulator receiver modulated diguanylate cyclase/phosphodiesterase with PAS/PAC sensor(s) [Gloeocapsa sp. PCC 7428]|uniref:two-component system response regulator n=1 Tax=Gloeocapsa sp. PCC 7428 TaxID=1173026 RepID=UPI0002A5E252|nr:EAL domain-containing protein [Gloeocapsa sp. PCC 7428]AFZ31343.1 response regulator receiver modulated diguanylate cyclase/phosphodiesterase with PAS/PAC sensor(s) [Gloeocapsa sp. PCC 7428]